jgi:hypothetical protein
MAWHGRQQEPFCSSRRLTRLPIQTTSMQLKKLLLQASAGCLLSLSVFGRARARGLFRFLLDCAPPALCSHYLRERPPTRNPIIHVPLAHQLCVSALSVFYCCFSGQTHARVNHFTFTLFLFYKSPTAFICLKIQLFGFVVVTFHKYEAFALSSTIVSHS